MANGSANVRHILIVAGESSGELHGANLILAAARKYPHLDFFGVGGRRMRDAGCRILFPSEELSVMGISEVFAQLPRIMGRLRQLKDLLKGNERPDLLVLIDFPDFNLRLAAAARNIGVPVLYYISPKVWAWRSGRARTIAGRVDRMALIFPFEPQIYQPLGVRAEYVGNPLLDEFAANPPRGDLRERLGISAGQPVIGIFPGSRNSELKYILKTLIETAQLITRAKPEARFLLPVAPSFSTELLERHFVDSGLPISIVEENIYDVAAACNAVLTVSGTVTLQLALTGTPMAILYKVAPLSYAIGRRLIKIEFAGLTNIVAGREIVREFIQDAAQPEAMCREILRLLDDVDYAAEMRKNLHEVRARLGEPGSSERVAAIVAEMSSESERFSCAAQ